MIAMNTCKAAFKSYRIKDNQPTKQQGRKSRPFFCAYLFGSLLATVRKLTGTLDPSVKNLTGLSETRHPPLSKN